MYGVTISSNMCSTSKRCSELIKVSAHCREMLLAKTALSSVKLGPCMRTRLDYVVLDSSIVMSPSIVKTIGNFFIKRHRLMTMACEVDITHTFKFNHCPGLCHVYEVPKVLNHNFMDRLCHWDVSRNIHLQGSETNEKDLMDRYVDAVLESCKSSPMKWRSITCHTS